MRPGAYIIVASAARNFLPLLSLFAFALLVVGAPGSGVGLLAGLAFGLALTLHALVFGVVAAKAAFPPFLVRVLLGLGLIAAAAAAGAPGASYAAQLIEAAVFVVTTAASALIVAVVFGRVPTLRDAEW